MKTTKGAEPVFQRIGLHRNNGRSSGSCHHRRGDGRRGDGRHDCGADGARSGESTLRGYKAVQQAPMFAQRQL